jgi:hypothetical protein
VWVLASGKYALIGRAANLAASIEALRRPHHVSILTEAPSSAFPSRSRVSVGNWRKMCLPRDWRSWPCRYASQHRPQRETYLTARNRWVPFSASTISEAFSAIVTGAWPSSGGHSRMMRTRHALWLLSHRVVAVVGKAAQQGGFNSSAQGTKGFSETSAPVMNLLCLHRRLARHDCNARNYI